MGFFNLIAIHYFSKGIQTYATDSADGGWFKKNNAFLIRQDYTRFIHLGKQCMPLANMNVIISLIKAFIVNILVTGRKNKKVYFKEIHSSFPIQNLLILAKQIGGFKSTCIHTHTHTVALRSSIVENSASSEQGDGILVQFFCCGWLDG